MPPEVWVPLFGVPYAIISCVLQIVVARSIARERKSVRVTSEHLYDSGYVWWWPLFAALFVIAGPPVLLIEGIARAGAYVANVKPLDPQLEYKRRMAAISNRRDQLQKDIKELEAWHEAWPDSID